MHIIFTRAGTFGDTEMGSEMEGEGENNFINNTTQGPGTDLRSWMNKICEPEVLYKKSVLATTLLG